MLYRSMYGFGHKRVCEWCIYKLAQGVDLNRIKEHERKLVIDAL